MALDVGDAKGLTSRVESEGAGKPPDRNQALQLQGPVAWGKADDRNRILCAVGDIESLAVGRETECARRGAKQAGRALFRPDGFDHCVAARVDHAQIVRKRYGGCVLFKRAGAGLGWRE